jgi:FKBP-type peptidyl-prolyl cis-trans isomerase
MKNSKFATAFLAAFAILLYVPVVAAQGAAPGKPSLPDAPAPQTHAAAPGSTPPQSAGAANAAPTGPFKEEKQNYSYAMGLSVGNALKRQSVDLDLATFDAGLRDGLGAGKALMTDEELRATMVRFQNEMKARQEEKNRLEASKNKEEGEAFLAANKTKPGVVVLPSGLQYKILTPGTGPKPTPADSVVCNYRGTLINGTEFDSSSKHGGPATFPVGRVIPGWTEALQLMPVGSKWELYVPSNLAYGERGAGSDIGPNSTLIFEVELVSIQGQPQAAPAKP